MKIVLDVACDPLSQNCSFRLLEMHFCHVGTVMSFSDFSHSWFFQRGTISPWSVSRAKQESRKKKEYLLRRTEGDGEQTGFNLIIRNAPELGNEGSSFRLTPSGRRCYSFVCRNAGLPFSKRASRCLSSSDIPHRWRVLR